MKSTILLTPYLIRLKRFALFGHKVHVVVSISCGCTGLLFPMYLWREKIQMKGQSRILHECKHRKQYEEY